MISDPIARLQNTFSERANFPCVRDSDGELTYQEFRLQACSLAEHLRRQGLQNGDRVLLTLSDRREFLLGYFACLFGGFVAIPINREMPERDQAYVVETTQPRFRLAESKDLQFESPASLDIHTQAKDLFAIFFTSGSTNRPKGVCHTAGAMLENVAAFNQLTNLDERTAMLHVMPIGYMAGFLNTVLSPLVVGGSVILAPQFGAASAMRFWGPAIEMGANAVWLTPTMAALLTRLNRSERVPTWTKANLRHVFVGTARLPEQTKEGFEKTFGCPCLESFGMTEVLLASSNSPSIPQLPGSAGTLLEGVEVRIQTPVDKNDADQQSGPLEVLSRYAMMGYLLPDGEIENSASSDGWFDTGDFGYVDEKRRITIQSRLKDLIIHGGTNVSPAAVEDVLLRYPEVADATVIGHPDDFWGEVVVAFLIAKANSPIDLAALEQYCREHLAPDAVPSIFRVVAGDFPRTNTGKVIKRHLKVES